MRYQSFNDLTYYFHGHIETNVVYSLHLQVMTQWMSTASIGMMRFGMNSIKCTFGNPFASTWKNSRRMVEFKVSLSLLLLSIAS